MHLLALRETCPNTEFFLVVFSYTWIVIVIAIQENTDQKKLRIGHFSGVVTGISLRN